MNWYKISQRVLTVWHVSNQQFAKFDAYKSGQGIVWFAKDKSDLLSNMHGASLGIGLPIYLYECQIAPRKMAGWEEYDKHSIGELAGMGYDAIDLDEDIAVIDVDNIKIIKVERLK